MSRGVGVFVMPNMPLRTIPATCEVMTLLVTRNETPDTEDQQAAIFKPITHLSLSRYEKSSRDGYVKVSYRKLRYDKRDPCSPFGISPFFELGISPNIPW